MKMTEKQREKSFSNEDLKRLKEHIEYPGNLPCGLVKGIDLKTLLERFELAEKVCESYGLFSESYGNANWQESQSLSRAYNAWRLKCGVTDAV